MKNISKSLFNKWGAGEQNPRQFRFMPTLSRTFGPGENPNTGRSASQFESRKTSKKSERAAESSRKAKEMRFEAESQVSDIKKAVDPGPTPVEPNRKDFANSDAGRRGYEFAQQDYEERKAKFDRDMYNAARDKVLAEEKQMAMLRSDNLLKDPGKAPTPPAMSGNKIRDAKTLKKYEKELSAWKENASAYLQQRTFLANLLKEQEDKENAKKSSTDTQKETLPKSDLDSIRQALSEKPSFSIGADKGGTFVRIDGGYENTSASTITASFDLSSAVGHVATINGGSLYHAPSKYDVVSTNVTVGGSEESPQWIVLKYTIGISIEILTSSMTAVPTSSNTAWYFGLHQVYINSTGTAAVVSNGGRRCFGDIVIGAFWSQY